MTAQNYTSTTVYIYSPLLVNKAWKHYPMLEITDALHGVLVRKYMCWSGVNSHTPSQFANQVSRHLPCRRVFSVVEVAPRYVFSVVWKNVFLGELFTESTHSNYDTFTWNSIKVSNMRASNAQSLKKCIRNLLFETWVFARPPFKETTGIATNWNMPVGGVHLDKVLSQACCGLFPTSFSTDVRSSFKIITVFFLDKKH